MAASSYTETTAVSFRKGDHDANNAFTGIAGEIVVDLGRNGKGTDNNTTVVVHNGITTGGIPLARADTGNITTKSLAENRPGTYGNAEKNLAYADLSNLEKTNNTADQTKIVETLTQYGLITGTNINTKLNSYAKKNMSNVNTADLATGENQTGKHSGKDLAYKDTTNINIADLADSAKHDNPVAYADGSNIITENLGNSNLHNKPLAYADLTNVAADDIINMIEETALNGLEKTSNKDNTINESNVQADHYPKTDAVINYVNSKLETSSQSAMKRDFLNATCYENLYENNTGTWYKYNNSNNMLVLNNQYLDKWQSFSTGKKLTGMTRKLMLHIDDPNEEANPTDPTSSNVAVSVNQPFGTTNVPNTNIIGWKGQTKIQGVLKSTSIGNGIYQYTVDNVVVTEPNPNSDYNSILHEGDFIKLEQDISVTPVLTIQATCVSDSNRREGPIFKFIYIPAKSTKYFADQTLTLVTDALKIKLNSIKTTEDNEGGKLLKSNLSNLQGMSEEEAIIAEDANWRIKPDEAIADTDATNVDEQEFYDIAVNGQVRNALQRERAWTQTQITAVSTDVSNHFVTLNTTQSITGTKTFSGIKVPDRADGDNTTNAANTKFVTKAINALSNSSLGMPDYSNPTELTESSGTASATGWIGLSTYNYAGGHFNFYINSSLICNIDRMDGDGSHEISCILPVKAGDTWSRSGGNAWHVYFYPNRS